MKKYNIKKDNEQINLYLNSISSNDVESLKNIFENYDLDFQEFVNEIDVEFKWRKFIYQAYKKKINIDPKDIEKEISDNLKTQNKLIEYNISEIEILANDNVSNKEIITLIQNEIKNYGFESAVSKYSISSTASEEGKLGWINSNSLSKEFVKILSVMNKGEVSKPIKKQEKIIFLKLNDKKSLNYSNIDLNEFKNNLLNQKKMNYLIYILIAIYLN